MINEVFLPVSRPAGELPSDVVLSGFGRCRVIAGRHTGMVRFYSVESRRVIVTTSPETIVSCFIPESWEDARLDIELDLMTRGI